MADLIDRDKVIEAIDDISVEIDEGYGFQYEKWRKYFCELPGVQGLNFINVDGLEEEIRCAMCKNPNRTDRGCDGNCKYDEKLYERIMQILSERIKPLPKPRKGKWIRTRTLMHDGELYCDQCGQEHPEQKKIWNFCPNCGCRMEEGDPDEKV